MAIDAEQFSSYMGITVKVALTAFMAIVSYAFQEIKTVAKEAQVAIAEHTTRLAVLENNYKIIDKKLDRIIDGLGKNK